MGLLQGMHAIVAMRMEQPHWLLNDADARVYGQALQNAIRHIPVRAAQKSIDFAMLACAVAQFELPRVYLSLQAAKAARQPRRPAAVVYPLNGGAQPRPGNGATRPAPPMPDMTYEPELGEAIQ